LNVGLCVHPALLEKGAEAKHGHTAAPRLITADEMHESIEKTEALFETLRHRGEDTTRFEAGLVDMRAAEERRRADEATRIDPV